METDSRTLDQGSSSFLRVRGLCKRYLSGSTLQKREVLAVRGVDFEISAGKTLGLVGSSGSGKSTVAHCVSRLERPNGGEICIDGVDIAQLGSRELFPFRAQIQMIFQDAATSMNPRFSAAEIVEEPLLIQDRGDRAERRDRARELMNAVGLSPDWADRSAMEFSGGQQQRLAIARALALKPKLLVLDEALSGLDLSTQTQIANLLLELLTSQHLTYLLISHDLPLVTRMADSIAVMSAGQIVEHGSAAQIVSAPIHPETQSLLGSTKNFQSNYSATLGPSL